MIMLVGHVPIFFPEPRRPDLTRTDHRPFRPRVSPVQPVRMPGRLVDLPPLSPERLVTDADLAEFLKEVESLK